MSTPSDQPLVQTDASTPAANDPVVVQSPEFADFSGQSRTGEPVALNRFYDVHVTVWAELGRCEVPLGDLLKMGEGAVVKLNRPITAPVDLVAQGVRIARGEVVVVDDYFAIRIKELEGDALGRSHERAGGGK